MRIGVWPWLGAGAEGGDGRVSGSMTPMEDNETPGTVCAEAFVACLRLGRQHHLLHVHQI